MITIESYNEEWPLKYKNEELELKLYVSGLIDVHHVGSTSVPGLSAKPIIDIIAIVKDRHVCIEPLEKLGYVFKGEYNIPFRSYFNKDGFNLHVYEKGHPEIELNLCFRDYLRSHPDSCREYEALKKHLAERADSSEKKGMFKNYTLGKDAFIKSCLNQAGYKSIRFLKATHFTEMAFANQYCDESSMQNPDHEHLILYEGTKIIGFADVDKAKNLSRYWVIESREKHFINSIEKWIGKRVAFFKLQKKE